MTPATLERPGAVADHERTVIDVPQGTPRRAIPKALRFQILRRDDHKCRYCGASALDAKLVVDHVVPVALGGETHPSNLVAACEPCNSGKAATPPDAATVEDVRADALRWKRAMEMAAYEHEDAEGMLEVEIDRFDCAWQEFPYSYMVPRPHDWRGSVETWLKNGLTERILVSLIPKALDAHSVPHSRRWNYFCGCAWNTLKKLQGYAREAIDVGVV